MLIIPSKSYYKKHLKQYSQYTFSKQWIDWAVKIIALRAKRVTKLLEENIDHDAKILDLGCAIGLSLHITSQVFPNIVGCDIDKNALEGCRQILNKVGKGKTKLVLYDGHKLPFKNNSLDAVLSIEVIEHVQNPKVMLGEIKRVLKKEGIMIISTPNKYWPIETHYKLPFLTYLPQFISDFYVKATGKGKFYDVYPLSYNQFLQMVGKNFTVTDITFDIVANYKKYNLDKERGDSVEYISWFINLIRKYQLNSIEHMISNFSEGWVLLARPKK